MDLFPTSVWGILFAEGKELIAQSGAKREVLRHRLLRDLLPGDVDEKLLIGGSLRICLTEGHQLVIGPAGFRTGAGRKRRLQFFGFFPPITEFLTSAASLKGKLGFEGGIEIHRH